MKSAHDDVFREGARSYDTQDICPQCGKNGVVFASDFKAMGRKKVRACQWCLKVFVNGEPQSDLTAFTPGSDGA